MNYRQKTVLVVDDDPDCRENFKEVARRASLYPLEADTAERALEIAKPYVIDSAIVDIFMPGKGGIWLIEELRARYPNVKIVSISGGLPEMPAELATLAASKIGANTVIAKPVSIAKLHEALQL